MDALPRQVLADLVHQAGLGIAEDATRLRALLLEQCPEHRLEIALLVAAAEEGVPARLTDSPDLAGVVEEEATLLEQQRGLSRTNAQWAVQSWTAALDGVPMASSDDTAILPGLGPDETQAFPAHGSNSIGDGGNRGWRPVPGSAGGGLPAPQTPAVLAEHDGSAPGGRAASVMPLAAGVGLGLVAALSVVGAFVLGLQREPVPAITVEAGQQVSVPPAAPAPAVEAPSPPTPAPAPPAAPVTEPVDPAPVAAPVRAASTEGTGAVSSQPAGLFCRDLKARGFSYTASVHYWTLHGQPERMDADKNGVPCETVYPGSDVVAYYGLYWTPQQQEPVSNGENNEGAAMDAEPGGQDFLDGLGSGLLCRDLAARGVHFGGALAYWYSQGMPDRMDVDRNGIPCETVYSAGERAPYGL